MLLKEGIREVYLPFYEQIVEQLQGLANEWNDIPMLARTHGQPASPTRLGKEIQVFIERLRVQMDLLKTISYKAKFGGATGNFNAHYVAYPDQDWHGFGDHFVGNYLGLERSQFTTQIEHYDNMAALFHGLMRINTILIDMARDMWTYISMEYFNPIDFENAEGNFGIANALFDHLANKLPISRLQRDLTDSTVLRNIGVPIGHTIIGFQSVLKGLGKLLLNEAALDADLEKNWMVVAEAIQNILRREGFDKPYEALKALTRGKAVVTKADIHAFVDGLAVTEPIRKELKNITPQNYVGK